MISFVKCPFCAGHEAISAKAVDAIANAIDAWVQEHGSPELICELDNIRNDILNRQERTAEPEYKPPLCPTPQKRKYSNMDHAMPDAIQWKQYAYECACGYWHLSKQSREEYLAKINSPAADATEFPDIDPLLA